jgi:hypothetical protein
MTMELQHALAVEPSAPELDEENIPQIEDMVSGCAGLVTVDEQTRVIRLVHYTTQEYFERRQTHWFQDAQSDISKTCLTYLSFDVFEKGFCWTDDDFEERLNSYHFYDYAAHNWGYHVRKASMPGHEAIAFLENRPKVEASAQALLLDGPEAPYLYYSQNIPWQMTGLHLAAYLEYRKQRTI